MVPELMAELAAAFRNIRASRGVVLTGAGRAFCVGADLKWAGSADDPAEAIREQVTGHHEAMRAMLDVPVPIVAAVNGAAAGGGLSLALAADYRIASSNATFTAAYFRLGLTPDGGNSAYLARMLGQSRAMELLLSNRRLSAEEALAWGLVAEMAPAEQLVERARQLIDSFGAIPPETLLTTRQLLDGGSMRRQLNLEETAMIEAARREQFHDALQAFLDKKPSP
jgi:2-(1,2-epoxy-1,2-dihydrophenyl)acetyl-CoA isomerase